MKKAGWFVSLFLVSLSAHAGTASTTDVSCQSYDSQNPATVDVKIGATADEITVQTGNSEIHAVTHGDLKQTDSGCFNFVDYQVTLGEAASMTFSFSFGTGHPGTRCDGGESEGTGALSYVDENGTPKTIGLACHYDFD